VNIFHREQRSLFGEILDWMLTPLLLLWPLSLVLTWLIAQDIAAKPYDRALGYNVAALAQLLNEGHIRPDETVVCLLSGAGFKDASLAQPEAEAVSARPPLAFDVDAIVEAANHERTRHA